MKKVMVRNHKGVYCYHGSIEKRVFKRVIDSRYIRWSSKSFCINVDAVSQIRRCKAIRFIYKKSDNTRDIYEIKTEDALVKEMIINEHGEKNLRIPIEECNFLKSVGIPIVKKGKLTPEIKTEKPLSLFDDTNEPQQRPQRRTRDSDYFAL